MSVLDLVGLIRKLGSVDGAHLVLADRLAEQGLSTAEPMENTAAAVLEAVVKSHSSDHDLCQSLASMLMESHLAEVEPTVRQHFLEGLRYKHRWAESAAAEMLGQSVSVLTEEHGRHDLVALLLPHATADVDIVMAAHFAPHDAAQEALATLIASPLTARQDTSPHLRWHGRSEAFLADALFMRQQYAAKCGEELARFPQREGGARANTKGEEWAWRFGTTRYRRTFGCAVPPSASPSTWATSPPCSVADWFRVPCADRWVLDGWYTAQDRASFDVSRDRIQILSPRQSVSGPVYVEAGRGPDPPVQDERGGVLADTFSNYVLAALGHKFRSPTRTRYWHGHEQRGVESHVVVPPLFRALTVIEEEPDECDYRETIARLRQRFGFAVTRLMPASGRRQGFSGDLRQFVVFFPDDLAERSRIWQLFARTDDGLRALASLCFPATITGLDPLASAWVEGDLSRAGCMLNADHRVR